jgi:hypothetical protein
MLEPRLAEMHLIVDETRQDITSLEIDDLCAGGGERLPDLLDALAANQHVRFRDSAFVDDSPVGQQECLHAAILMNEIPTLHDRHVAVVPRCGERRIGLFADSASTNEQNHRQRDGTRGALSGSLPTFIVRGKAVPSALSGTAALP